MFSLLLLEQIFFRVTFLVQSSCLSCMYLAIPPKTLYVISNPDISGAQASLSQMNALIFRLKSRIISLANEINLSGRTRTRTRGGQCVLSQSQTPQREVMSGLHVARMRLKYYTEALQQSQLQPNHRITA